MNFSSHCSQIYCLALQSLPSLLMFTLNSHRTFTFTFWVPCWSGWINFKSFSFPSDQLIKFSRLEDVSCLECLYCLLDFLNFFVLQIACFDWKWNSVSIRTICLFHNSMPPQFLSVEWENLWNCLSGLNSKRVGFYQVNDFLFTPVLYKGGRILKRIIFVFSN